MKSVWTIAANTYREIIRDRILYGIVVFALLLIGLSLALGQLSFAEQARISADFGFAGIQMGVSILSIFIGSSLVSKEIEKQTILTLLARPITRTQFLLGKFVGLGLVILTVMLGLAVVLLGVVSFLQLGIEFNFAIAILGILLEALLLVSVALFFGTFARPMMTAVFSVALFVIGHWISSLEYFIDHSKDPLFKGLAFVISRVVPDFERFNWRSAPVYGLSVPCADVGFALVYAAGWIIVLLTATSIIFRRRDFV